MPTEVYDSEDALTQAELEQTMVWAQIKADEFNVWRRKHGKPPLKPRETRSTE